MKILFYILFFAISHSFCLNAQNIEIKETVFGVNYYQNGKKLSMRKLASTIGVEGQGGKYIIKAKSNNDITQVFSFIGGAFIGWPIGTKLGGGEPNWNLAGIGLGVTLIAIPFSISSKKNAKKAISLYNETLNTGLIKEQRSFRSELNFTQNGIGICLNF